jgi:hypothetical protein
VIEEIVGVGLKGVGIESPTTVGDGDAELMFFVALAVQRDKSKIVLIDELNERTGGGKERRRLIVMAVKGTEGPFKVRNDQCCAEARAGGRFADSAGKMCWPNPGGEGQEVTLNLSSTKKEARPPEPGWRVAARPAAIGEFAITSSS